MKKKAKKLVIDARALVRGSGGIQRYVQNVLTHLVNDPSFEIVLYSDHPIESSFDINVKQMSFRNVPHGFASSIAWHLWVCLWASKDQPDVYWSPRHHLPLFLPKKTKSIVTIHDFVWKTLPATMPWLQLVSEKVLMPLAIKKASRIICVSKTTQSLLERFFTDSIKKSSVIAHGQSRHSIDRKSSHVEKPGYYLAVGTLEPRKNYKNLICAFNRYLNEGGSENLIIVGKEGWKYKSILRHWRNSEHTDRIKIRSGVSDKELTKLYLKASGFVSPSLDEGYGLPPQEAMRFGLPIMLSNIAVYRELYLDADLWVDPLSIKDIVLGLHQLEKTPRTKTKDPKTAYSWGECARKHIEEILTV